jgi:hypothetical protein
MNSCKLWKIFISLKKMKKSQTENTSTTKIKYNQRSFLLIWYPINFLRFGFFYQIEYLFIKCLHIDLREPNLLEWTRESRIQLISPYSRSDPIQEAISPGFWVIFKFLGKIVSIFIYFQHNSEKIFSMLKIFFNLRLIRRFEKSIFYFKA